MYPNCPVHGRTPPISKGGGLGTDMREPSFGGPCERMAEELPIHHGWCWAQQVQKCKQYLSLLTDSFIFCFLLANIKFAFFCQRQKSLKGGGREMENYFLWKLFPYFYQASELCDRSWLCTNYSASFKFCKTVATNATFSYPSGWRCVQTYGTSYWKSLACWTPPSLYISSW